MRLSCRMPSGWLVALAAGAMLACPDPIMPEYTLARDAALSPSPALTNDWKADATMFLSDQLVADMAKEWLRTTEATQQSNTILGGKGTIDVELKMTDVVMSSASAACSSCLAVNSTMKGELTYAVGPLKGKAPLTVQSAVDVEVFGVEQGKDWKAHMKIRDVRNVSVRSEKLPKSLEGAVDKPLTKQVRQQLVEQTPPYEMTTFEGSEMPLRAMRAAHARSGILIEMLTAANTLNPLPEKEQKAPPGWRFTIHQDSLLDLARTEAIRNGPVGWDVVPEPTSLKITGSKFEMGLRLWMVSGSGWWRDYEITGMISRKGEKFSLKATNVVEGEASDGASMADPLAALGESLILSTIEENLAASFPATNASDMGGYDTETTVSSMGGMGSTFVVTGTMKILSGDNVQKKAPPMRPPSKTKMRRGKK